MTAVPATRRLSDRPLLIAAGPGTGKTEVLVARCLKFICCDSVAPGSIILTTFTEKAAKSLQDRLAEAFLFLAGMYPQLATIDPADLRIGTLHGLAGLARRAAGGFARIQTGSLQGYVLLGLAGLVLLLTWSLRHG